MKIDITVEQARKLYLSVNVIEWDALTIEAKDSLRHLGIGEDEFNELMYHLYNQTCVVVQ